jgi:hypothetical protein
MVAAVKDYFTGMPTWAQVVAKLGFPIAVAIWLIWFVTQTVNAQLTTNSEMLQRHMASTAIHDQNFNLYLQNHAHELDTLRVILSQICANGAANREERQGCFPAPVHPEAQK